MTNTSGNHIAIFIAIIRPTKEGDKTFTRIFVRRHSCFSIRKPAACSHIPSSYSIHREIIVRHIKIFRIVFPIAISGHRTNRMVICKNTHEINGRFKRNIYCFTISVKSLSFINPAGRLSFTVASALSHLSTLSVCLSITSANGL